MVNKPLSAFRGGKPHDDKQRLMSAARAQAEELERRYLLSLAGSLAGPPTAITEGSATNLILTTTGSAAPSSATIYPFSDSTSPDPFSSVGSPPAESTDHQTYSTHGTYSAHATTSPSVGTIPLSLDNAFNTSGSTAGSLADQPPGSTSSDDNSGKAIAVDGRNGIVFVLSAFNETSTTSSFCVTKYLADGTVDGSWGNHSPTANGTCVFNFDSGKDVPSAMQLVESDNCLMVAGNSSVDGWCVAEIHSGNGFLNGNFNSTGMETNFHLAGTCTSVIMETDSVGVEKVLLGGWEVKNGAPQMLVIRLSANGGVDSGSFNHNSTTAGELYVNAFPNTTGSKAFTIEQDIGLSNDIFLGGYSSRTVGSCTACDFAIAAVTPDGVLDSSWGNNSNGTTTTNFQSSACSHAIGGCSGSGNVSNDADYSLLSWRDTGASGQPWYLYAVGETDFEGGGNEFAMERLTATGSVDTSWQSYGLTAVASGPASGAANSTAQSAALQGGTNGTGGTPADQDPNAKILAAGTGTPGTTGTDFVVARFLMSGNLDTTFGSSGSVSTDLANSTFSTGSDNALGVGWDTNDGLIFVGGSTGPNATGHYYGLAAYISNTVQVNARSRPRPVAPQLGGKSAAAAAAQPMTTGVLDPADAATWKHRRRAADLFAPGKGD